MANAKPWLTSDGILSSLKRKITMPDSQELLTDEEILAFVNEEMFVSMVPSILSYHEEFFVTRMLEGGAQELDLQPNVSRYPIPSRAVGSRLRDLFFQDETGRNLREMTRINPDDKIFFSSNYTDTASNIRNFYLESNELILVPGVNDQPSGSLVFTYFLRPNQLVATSRAAIISTFTRTITVSLSTLVSGDTVVINNVVFTAGTDFAIAGTATLTAANLVTAVNTVGTAVATNVGAIVTLAFTNSNVTLTTSNEVAFAIPDTIMLVCDSTIPVNITVTDLVDFIQTAGGHQSRAISVPITSITNNTITFDSNLVPTNLVTDDYVCAENECIIPQIPTDLHIDLVERASARILAALGDTTGLQVVSAKILENERKQGVLIDNRVDGSPQKVIQRNGLLRRGRNRRWF